MNAELIAMVCHEANRAYCAAIGDNSQAAWAEAAEWQRNSALCGVHHRLVNPGTPPSSQHEQWLLAKMRDGWTYGPVKDADKKQHPCMVPYDELPAEQRIKDEIFAAIVDAMSPLLDAQRA